MEEIHVYIIILIITVLALNSNFSFGKKLSTNVSEQNLLVIEHLTQFSSRKKNYRKTPENYSSNGYLINGEIVGDSAYLEYKFPLIDSSESLFKIKLYAQNTSSVVSQYGIGTDIVESADGKIRIIANDVSTLQRNMNKDGFYFNSIDDFGINYNHVIQISQELGNPIAMFIKTELEKKGKDSYENRIRAALNFVQFIPYGVPEFDHEQDIYWGLALPHESLAISYSDCDSKSVLFATILVHLIRPENIIMAGCVMKDMGAHMIAGVAGFNYPGEYVAHNGKDFLLIETTTPHPLEAQPVGIYENIEVIPVKLI
jgi:hypothetical protein